MLVVDDNATNRQIVEAYLDGCGARVEQAADGRRGADACMHAACRAGEPFELVVLDYNMPGMDGLELARAIRRAPSLRGARLVMLTSSGDHRAAAREAGRRAHARPSPSAARGCWRPSPRRSASAPASARRPTGTAPAPAVPRRGRRRTRARRRGQRDQPARDRGDARRARDRRRRRRERPRGARDARARPPTTPSSWTARCPSSTATPRPPRSAPASASAPASRACRSSR